MLRRVELICGLLAGALGPVVVIGFALAIGRSRYEDISILFFAMMILSAVGAAAGAYHHSHWGGRGWLILLWACAVVLLVWTVLGVFSIGPILFPAALLALVAAVAGSAARRRQTSA